MFDHFLSTDNFAPSWGGFGVKGTWRIMDTASLKGICGAVIFGENEMKKLILLLVLSVALFATGCQQRSRGTRTVRETWDNTTIVDNPIAEMAKVFKGQPTGNTGKTQDSYEAQRYSSWTDENMPKHWR